jgi:hypothetical protein
LMGSWPSFWWLKGSTWKGQFLWQFTTMNSIWERSQSVAADMMIWWPEKVFHLRLEFRSLRNSQRSQQLSKFIGFSFFCFRAILQKTTLNCSDCQHHNLCLSSSFSFVTQSFSFREFRQLGVLLLLTLFWLILPWRLLGLLWRFQRAFRG